MKRILLFAVIFTLGVTLFSSCYAGRKGTGCPSVASQGNSLKKDI